jgi:putative phosphoesterase
MKRFAVLTDIHGNASALKAVLKEIDERRDVDHIYCLGDMLGIGPDSNEVLGMLFDRNDVSMITGNHDEAILAMAKGEEYPQSHIHVNEHHQWIVDRLDQTFIPKLERLPRLLNVTIDSYSILMIHYQIENSKLDVHISRDHFSSIVEPNTENMETLFFDKKVDLICFGHHHPLHYFTGKHTVYLNPGALGCNHKPLAPYAIVTVKNNDIEVSLKEAVYDNTAFLKSYHTLQVPEREFILKVFHGNQI